MAGRIRSIKPEILEDERSAGLSSDAWRLWVSTWLLADDHGRLRGSPAWLASQVFWLVKPREDLARLLEELESARLVLCYEVDGQQYIEIRNWRKHQRVDHPSQPRIPLPPTGSANPRETFAKPRETLASKSERLAPDQDQDLDLNIAPKAHVSAPKFDLKTIADRYPRRKDVAKGLAKLKALVKDQETFDAVSRGLDRFIAEEKRKGTGVDFLPYFQTWVNGRRWEDEDDLPLGPTPQSRDYDDYGDLLRKMGAQ